MSSIQFFWYYNEPEATKFGRQEQWKEKVYRPQQNLIKINKRRTGCRCYLYPVETIDENIDIKKNRSSNVRGV